MGLLCGKKLLLYAKCSGANQPVNQGNTAIDVVFMSTRFVNVPFPR